MIQRISRNFSVHQGQQYRPKLVEYDLQSLRKLCIQNTFINSWYNQMGKWDYSWKPLSSTVIWRYIQEWHSEQDSVKYRVSIWDGPSGSENVHCGHINILVPLERLIPTSVVAALMQTVHWGFKATYAAFFFKDIYQSFNKVMQNYNLHIRQRYDWGRRGDWYLSFLTAVLIPVVDVWRILKQKKCDNGEECKNCKKNGAR